MAIPLITVPTVPARAADNTGNNHTIPTTTNCAGRLFLPRVMTTTMVRNARGGGGGGDLADAQRRRGEDQTRRKESERTYAISYYTWNDP